MALTTIIELETHGSGTVGLSGIVDGNWSRLDTVFGPTLSTGDTAYPAFWRALTRNATDPTTYGAAIEWDDATNKPTWRAGYALATYAASYSFDMAGAKIQEMVLTGNLTFSALTNPQAGRELTVIIASDASIRTLTFPAWTWVGATVPANIAASKTARLKLTCIGTTAADTIAEWVVEA